MPGESERITFVYEGTEYDASDYTDKHPGGRAFI
jgi:cytochrome b involved in lipid metabolism